MSEALKRPDVVYLQGFCDECGDPPRDADVTWCQDDIGCAQCGASDLRYVRESEGAVECNGHQCGGYARGLAHGQQILAKRGGKREREVYQQGVKDGRQQSNEGVEVKLLGNVRDEVIRTQRDDGVTQVATVQEQVGIDEAVVVPTNVFLAPHRTFPEIAQPTSQYLLRLRRYEDGPAVGKKGGVQARLFIADNEAWRVEAVQNIAAYLRNAVGNSAVVLA